MKKIGKIITLDERFGTIVDDEGRVSFSRHDCHDKELAVGQVVTYRKENHGDIFLARNIKVLRKDVSHKD